MKHSFLYWGGFTWVQSRCTHAFLYSSSRNWEFSFVCKRKEQHAPQANGVVQGCQGDQTHIIKQGIYQGAGLGDGAKAERVLEIKERGDCQAVEEVPAEVLTMEVQLWILTKMWGMILQMQGTVRYKVQWWKLNRKKIASTSPQSGLDCHQNF